jgi:predicted ATPase
MKYVITGGPCSGKTTLIDKLKGQGFGVLEEVAREVLAKNSSLPFHDLQTEIYNIQITREKQIEPSTSPYFLDRGWIDGHAYFKQYKGVVPEEFLTAPVKRYEQIFVLDRLPLVNDSVRLENEQIAASLHKNIVEAYTNAGYKPIIVPATGVENRLDFILSYTNQLIGGR